ncbi:MAG: FHA domain-containing protein [Clostridium sp.]|nr:FHA domain-containing protein [Bacteroides sp.]MCM1198484.1 FHA domain-containing protein [Clostridium sp.]
MKILLIGRTPENDIVIEDPLVTRHHLQIVIDDNGGYSAVDLNSTNGTYVNGLRIMSETKLSPGDIVKIGNTVVPWEEYAVRVRETGNGVPQNLMDKGKRRQYLIFVVLGVLLLVFAGGGLALKMCHDDRQQTEDKRQQTAKSDSLRKAASLNKMEAERLQKEADELYIKALKSQNKEDKALAERKQKEADIAKKAAEDANAAQKKAEEARQKAENEKSAAIEARKQAEKERNQAEKARQEVERQHAEEVKIANAERDEANRRTELTEAFYSLYVNLEPKRAVMACEKLKISLNKSKDAKDSIKESFNKADNIRKQEIIDVLTSVSDASAMSQTDTLSNVGGLQELS